jgi:hypothetical protein
MVYAPTTLLPYYMSYEHSWAPTFFMACVHAHEIAHITEPVEHRRPCACDESKSAPKTYLQCTDLILYTGCAWRRYPAYPLQPVLSSDSYLQTPQWIGMGEACRPPRCTVSMHSWIK